jgi:hypothetical protein
VTEFTSVIKAQVIYGRRMIKSLDFFYYFIKITLNLKRPMEVIMKPTREQCLEALRQASIKWELITEDSVFTENTDLTAILEEDGRGDFDDISQDAETKLGLDLEDGMDHEPATPGEWLNWIETQFPEEDESGEEEKLNPRDLFAAAVTQDS